MRYMDSCHTEFISNQDKRQVADQRSLIYL